MNESPDVPEHPDDVGPMVETVEVVDFDEPTDFGPMPPPAVLPEADPEADAVPVAEPVLEVRRHAVLAAVVGVVAAAVAIAYLTRAVDSGSPVAWAVCGLMSVVALVHLAALLDSRTPLLVADDQGVRIRLGRSWTGLTWGALQRVEVVPRLGLHDGRLVLVPRNPARVLEELDKGARRSARLSGRLHGSPFGVPLSLATRVVGDDGDLAATLARLAGGRAEVTGLTAVDATDAADAGDMADEADEVLPARPRWAADPRPALAHGIGVVAARLRTRGGAEATEDGGPPERHSEREEALPLVASATPSPLRALISGQRAEVHRELVAGAHALAPDLDDADYGTSGHGLPELDELRRPGSVDLELETESWGDRVRPIASPGDAVETIVIEDFPLEPAEDPVIGPEFAAARTRLGLTVDALADRTRIRPHVIESIEVDDFAPCGGDFYARGHVRTLARVLGVDAAPLLAAYDERYADAPVNPRRVFEAELASSGGIRATRGGPNWSVLVAAVMALVLAWSIARLVMDGPVDLRDDPVLNGSGGPNHQGAPAAPAVPVVVSAPSSGARIIVRDGSGEVVFTGDLAFGASRTFSVSPPVRVQATDGSVTVTVDGDDRGALGAAGTPGSGTFVVR